MLSPKQLHAKYLGDVSSEGFMKEAFGFYRNPDKLHSELDYIRQGHAAIPRAWQDIHKGIERIGKNFAVTPGERTKMIAQVAAKRRDDVTVLVDVTRQRAYRQQTHIAGRIEQVVRPANPTHAALMPELRAHLFRLGEADRYDLLASARGDDAVMLWHAVASAPAFLSGVVEGKRLDCRNNLIGLREPELLELEPGVAAGLALLDKASSRLTELVDDHVDFDSAAELRSLEVEQ